MNVRSTLLFDIILFEVFMFIDAVDRNFSIMF